VSSCSRAFGRSAKPPGCDRRRRIQRLFHLFPDVLPTCLPSVLTSFLPPPPLGLPLRGRRDPCGHPTQDADGADRDDGADGADVAGPSQFWGPRPAVESGPSPRGLVLNDDLVSTPSRLFDFHLLSRPPSTQTGEEHNHAITTRSICRLRASLRAEAPSSRERSLSPLPNSIVIEPFLLALRPRRPSCRETQLVDMLATSLPRAACLRRRCSRECP